MNFLAEYRDPKVARRLLDEIRNAFTRPCVIMEVCGGQTHAIVRNGIDELLPKEIELVHGPGCPVCVTSLELIEKALAIASIPGLIFVSFGDMLRVPGSRKDLLMVRSEGADIRAVYSPLEALKIAKEHPDRQVVFFAVGFETTAPNTAMLVAQAAQEGVTNLSLLVSHVLVPPAMTALLDSPQNRVQAYLAAGHVCTVMGWQQYEPIARKYSVPIIVTGFEPLDLLSGILSAVRQLEAGEAKVENQYARMVSREGNRQAQQQIDDVFEVCDRAWRGIGVIPQSGLRLREKYQAFDAEKRFAVVDLQVAESPDCMSGVILQGLKKPAECPHFGKRCTPSTPLGATMVSSEGACAAYYHYHRTQLMAKD